MKPLFLELGLGEALGLFLCLAEGDARCARTREMLRTYLYEHLSIDEMEHAEELYRSNGPSLAGRIPDFENGG